MNSYTQNPSFVLTFTALNNTQNQPLDYIKITNLTQGCDTILHFPDTILVLDYLSLINENRGSLKSGFSLVQNFPNPFKNQTLIKLHIYEEQNIRIRISDLLGRQLVFYDKTLQRGLHSFTFYPAKENYYLFTVIGKYTTKTIKMSGTGSERNTSFKIDYTGFTEKTISEKLVDATNNFCFSPGDELFYIGNAEENESAISGSPLGSQLIEFQFATNIPCPGITSVTYEGQTYNTIQVLSQCWLKENLNYETGDSWCFGNNNNNCEEYGRLYLWEATLDICPPGWHLPTDEEWKILEGCSDSQYKLLNPAWENSGIWRGFDGGYNLKSDTGWHENGNGADIFELAIKPGGYRFTSGNFFGPTSEGGYWTSSEFDSSRAWNRYFSFSETGIYRYPFDKGFGFYVRCLKD